MDQAVPATAALLERLWFGLEQAGVNYCLLRGATRLTPPPGDVDLLVAHGDIESFHQVADALGFMLKRRWCDDTQHHLIGLDEMKPIVLHAVTEVGFGHPDFPWVLDIAEGILERADVHGSDRPVVAARHDEFWITLHHCLLDKGAVRRHHQGRLQELSDVASVTDDGCSHLDPSVRQQLLMHARMGAWDQLLSLAPLVQENLRRGQRLSGHLRHVRRSTELRIRKVGERFTRRAISVALLAPDGAGKSTLAEALVERLPVPSRIVYLGQYPQGAQPPGRLPGWSMAVRILRLWRTWIRVRRMQMRGQIVIFDRHTMGARLPSTNRSLKRRIRRWVLGRALPEPDLVLILDAPAELLHRRSGEHDVTGLEHQRVAHLQLACGLRNPVVLDATQPADLVAERASAEVWQSQLRRHRRRGRR